MRPLIGDDDDDVCKTFSPRRGLVAALLYSAKKGKAQDKGESTAELGLCLQ